MSRSRSNYYQEIGLFPKVKLMKCRVNWIPVRICFRSRNTQFYLTGINQTNRDTGLETPLSGGLETQLSGGFLGEFGHVKVRANLKLLRFGM